MFGLNHKLSENLIFLILISFVFASLLGMSMGMEIKEGQMSGCPFTVGQTTMCQMSVTEHIAQWQRTLLGIPIKGDTLILAVLLFSVTPIPFVKPFFQLEKLTELVARLLAYHKANLIKVFDPLLIAFSDGILNPKIY